MQKARTTRRRLRLMFMASVAAAIMIVNVLPAVAAGGGMSETSDGVRTLVGSGTWGPEVGGSTLTVFYQCQATATPDAVSTSIKPASDGGCVFKKNGVVVDAADGRTVPGPEAITAGVASVSVFGIESLQVCWDVHASFSNGALLETDDCSDLNLSDLPIKEATA